ncbi:MAG: class I SAM-dependent methyltransferase [Deltaproteobacteria bacterium]|nr:MAG: class I SAM-dependent methyltransferase [Deltaproteobacteria bacterium]
MAQKVYEKPELYEIFSSRQDFKKESDFVVKLAKQFKKSKGNSLLNVGCGTGAHDKFLKKYFDLTGIDLNKKMLELAKKKNPKLTYKIGNMKSFSFSQKFDVITALTGVMSYNHSYKELKNTLTNLYKHLEKGGILVFNWAVVKEVAFEKGKIKNYVKVDTISRKDLDCVVIDNAYDPNRNDTTIETNVIFLIRKNRGPLKIVVDKHLLGLFELKKVRKILREIGFKCHLYENDFSGEKYKMLGPIFVCLKS